MMDRWIGIIAEIEIGILSFLLLRFFLLGHFQIKSWFAPSEQRTLGASHADRRAVLFLCSMCPLFQSKGDDEYRTPASHYC